MILFSDDQDSIKKYLYISTSSNLLFCFHKSFKLKVVECGGEYLKIRLLTVFGVDLRAECFDQFPEVVFTCPGRSHGKRAVIQM